MLQLYKANLRQIYLKDASFLAARGVPAARASLQAAAVMTARWNATVSTTLNDAPPPKDKEGTLYIDSIFPVQLGLWDIRHYIALSQKKKVVSHLKDTLSKLHVNGFRIESIEPRVKDGGAFVKFRYVEPAKEEKDAPAVTDAASLEAEIKRQVKEAGGIRAWVGNREGEVWLVRGKPWREDMRRYAATTIKVNFEGPDIYQETLYDLLRPYGQISDITNPVPVPAGNLRYSTVKFSSVRSAVRAHNCVHGFTLVDEPAIPGQSAGGKPTRLASVYERKIRSQAIRDWIGSHPRIVIPVIVFLLGTLSYIVFDPIRTLVVQAKVMEWLDVKEFRIVKWLKANTIDRITFLRSSSASTKSPVTSGAPESLWKDRKEAERALRAYLSEAPSTIAFVHGPQGSGKTSMLNRALSRHERRVLLIDCELLNKGKSDADVINGLAEQTGYWPVFTWLNNFTNLIDLASVGLIGQKSGLSTSVETQLKDILGVVGDALKGISVRHKEIQKTKKIVHAIKDEARGELQKIEQGTAHDGRLDTVAGTGVISELGIGDEKMTEKDEYQGKTPKSVEKAVSKVQDAFGKGKEAVEGKDKQDKAESNESSADSKASTKSGWAGTAVGAVQGAVQGVVKETKQGAEKVITGAKDQLGLSPSTSGSHSPGPGHAQNYPEKTGIDEEIKALPVVVIKNYATKSSFTDELVVVLAEWAAGLADAGTAHVVVMSDNRDNGRRLAKALPSKPLTSIALEDADPSSALSFVQDKLSQFGVKSNLSKEQKLQIGRLGGRSSDLESLCHKVKNGMPVEMAVEDIIARGVGELRKNAFGEEIEDAKALAWSKEQVFFILKSLAKTDELPYYDTLLDFPFKGDEASLRGMEHAELISITTLDGRPSTIRPGKPVYRFVFERLVNDPTFRSVQEIALNEKAIASAESAIRACEEELLRLKQIKPLDSGMLSSGATSRRINFLLRKLEEAEVKLETLETKNTGLKKGLKQP